MNRKFARVRAEDRYESHDTVVFVESGVNAVITLPPANYQTSPRLLYRDNNRLSIPYIYIYTSLFTRYSIPYRRCTPTLYCLSLVVLFYARLFGKFLSNNRNWLSLLFLVVLFFSCLLYSIQFLYYPNDTIIISKLQNVKRNYLMNAQHPSRQRKKEEKEKLRIHSDERAKFTAKKQ